MADSHGTKASVVWFLLYLSVGFSCAAESSVAQESLDLGEPDLPAPALTSEGDVAVLSDGVDLREGGDSTFRPTTLDAHVADQTFKIDVSVENQGNTKSGAFTVRCCASKDTTISTLPTDSPGDRNYPIADVSMGPIGAGNRAFSQANVSFPTDIPGGTYYVGWVIDAYNKVAEDDESNNTAYKSDILTVRGDDPGMRLLMIDDFESYTDDLDASQAIFQTWLDGSVNGTGSQVGYLTPPYAERTLVRTGEQSMPLQYNNSVAPYYSETTRTWPVRQNWTSALRLKRPYLLVWVRSAPKYSESGGVVLLSGAGTDIWGQSDEFRFAYRRFSGDCDIWARVVSNGLGSNTWAKGGVMIRDNLDPGSKHAMMVLTGGAGGGAAFQWRSSTNGTSQSTPDLSPSVSPPYWVRIQRVGNRFTASINSDGSWPSWKHHGQTQTISMTDPVYVGLCVTSHASGELRTYQFDELAKIGDVQDPNPQVVDIGPSQPGNDPADMYFAIEDEGRHVAVFDVPGAVSYPGWTPWTVPLDYFSSYGVNLAAVKMMHVGVGRRPGWPLVVESGGSPGATPPLSRGSGTVYCDEFSIETQDISYKVSLLGFGVLEGHLKDASGTPVRPVNGGSFYVGARDVSAPKTPPIWSLRCTLDMDYYRYVIPGLVFGPEYELIVDERTDPPSTERKWVSTPNKQWFTSDVVGKGNFVLHKDLTTSLQPQP